MNFYALIITSLASIATAADGCGRDEYLHEKCAGNNVMICHAPDWTVSVFQRKRCRSKLSRCHSIPTRAQKVLHVSETEITLRLLTAISKKIVWHNPKPTFLASR